MNAERLAQVSFAKIINSRQQKGGTRLHKHLLVLRILQKVREVFTGAQRLKRQESLEQTDSDMDDSDGEDEPKLTEIQIEEEKEEEVEETLEDSDRLEETVMDLQELSTNDISDPHQPAIAQCESPPLSSDSVTATSSCSATTCTIVFSPNFSASLCCSSPKLLLKTNRRKRLSGTISSCRQAKKRVRLESSQLHPVLRGDQSDPNDKTNLSHSTSTVLDRPGDQQVHFGLFRTLTSVARLPCGTILATTSDSLRPKPAILTPT